MAVNRSARLIPVYKYATSIALVPPQDYFTNPTPALGTVAGWPPTVGDWAFVPTFQRGMAWKRDDVNQLITASSEVLGTTIWASFAFARPFQTAPAPTPPRPQLNYEPIDVLHLVDGLQRFAITTAVLASLDFRGALTTGPLASSFARLAASVSGADRAIVLFNHHVLANYARPALAQQYRDFFQDMDHWVDDQSAKADWPPQVEAFFLDRQIGVDVYTGYSSLAALASNFVGINTGSQQLGMVDIFRAQIIEDGLLNGWTAAEALDFDTGLTDTLVQSDRAGRITPLATQLGQLTARGGTARAVPSLGKHHGTALRAETAELIDRLRPYCDSSATPNPYSESAVEEIYQCGKLPISLLAAHDIDAGRPAPWYAASLATAPMADLLVLLRAFYRVYIAGLEGRQTDTLIALLDAGRPTQSLRDLAQTISTAATETPVGTFKGIDDPVDRAWLRIRLESIPKRRAARVFAACELPPSFASATGPLVTPAPTTFVPQPYGTKNASLQIDHLIPVAAGGASSTAEETLRNFAPIPTALNRALTSSSCATKLQSRPGDPAGYEDLVVGSFIPKHGATPSAPHPYTKWLVRTHAPSHAATDLNDRDKLNGVIGDERIKWLVDRLIDRL